MTLEEAWEVIKAAALPWPLDSATFASLGESQAIARVSVREDTFFVLVDGRVSDFQVFALEESSLPALLDWCLKMAATGGDKP